MNQRVVTGLLTAGCIALAGAGYMTYKNQDRTAPEIKVDQSKKIAYTEGEDYGKLLEGVTAQDDKDGDLTSEVFVEKVVPVSKKKAVVYYGVTDKAKNVGTASREVTYQETEGSDAAEETAQDTASEEVSEDTTQKTKKKSKKAKAKKTAEDKKAEETTQDAAAAEQQSAESVIPVANPWGFSQKPKKRNNVSGYTLQSFDKKKNIKEVYYIKKYINRIKSDLSFMVDMHTTTNDSYLDFYGVIHKNCPNVRTLFRVNSWLCDQYAKEGRNVDDQYFGYRTSSCTLNYYCYKVLGIPSSTLELSDYHWDSKKNTSKVITMGVTMWLNYIIQQVNDEYKNMGNDIPSDKYKKVKG